MKNTLVINSVGLEELEQLASLLSKLFGNGDIVLLDGDLGAGKTTFTQFLTKHLHVKDSEYVASPSYSLLHQYSADIPVSHMDLYRLVDEEDVENAGLVEYIGTNGLCIIEWPERLGSLIPEVCLAITLQICDAETRNVTITFLGTRWLQERDRIAQFIETMKI